MSAITITPFLWFDDNAEPAAERYLATFPDATLVAEQRHPDGNLFVATIRLQGRELTLMNGGPAHQLTDAFSLQVFVDSQEEIEDLTAKLIDGGGRLTMCGWLVDAFGLSWQIVPRRVMELFADPDREAAGRAQEAMMGMQKLDIAELELAFAG
jgi:predicted 3-demethylubiquinone-9 3-methyltransferase (glyoxalase superfamily)